MSRPKRSKNPTSRPASGAAQGEGRKEGRKKRRGWDGMGLERIIEMGMIGKEVEDMEPERVWESENATIAKSSRTQSRLLSHKSLSGIQPIPYLVCSYIHTYIYILYT